MRRTQVVLSDASGGAKTSSPIIVDYMARPPVSLQIDVTGTVNWTVQQTLDDLFDSTITATWFDHPDTANMVAQTTAKQGRYDVDPGATRIVLNSGTGSVRYVVLQNGATV